MKAAIAALFIFSSLGSTAQLLAFTSKGVRLENNNSALLLMNPAFAGTSGGTRIQSTAVSRNLMESFRSAVMQTSIDHYLSKAHAGIGISAATSQFNTFGQTDIAVSWAQHFELSKNRVKLIPAITMGYRRIRADFLSSSLPPPRPSAFIMNSAYVGSSALLEIYERLYIGVVITDISLIKINRTPEQRYRSASKIVHMSYNLQVSKNDLLQAVVRFNSTRGLQNYQVGANYLHKSILVGAGVDIYDASYFQVGYKSDLLSASFQTEIVHSRLAGNMSPSFGLNLAATIRETHLAPVWKSIETW